MDSLRDKCQKLLRVPIRMLRAWIDQDRNDGRTTATTVSEFRARCEAYLAGNATDDDVRWIFGYVTECRRAYRGGARFTGEADAEYAAESEPVVRFINREPDDAETLIDLTDAAVRKFATSEQSKRYQSFRKCGRKASTSQSTAFAVSRATLHESIEKARQVGRAGVLLLAAYDDAGQYDSLLFGESFARTTPYTLKVFSAFEGILTNHRSRLNRRAAQLTRGFFRLWQRANAELHATLTEDGPTTETVTRLIHTTCFVQTLAARWGGERFRPAFEETWSILKRNGGLACPSIELLYSNIGSYCGNPDHQLRHLTAPDSGLREFSGLISFIRGVTQPGRPVMTRRFLSQPEAVVEQFVASSNKVDCDKLIEVMQRYLHNPLNHNVGLLRKILAWVETWAGLIIDRDIPINTDRLRRLSVSLEQYRRKLCATPSHTRVWQRAMLALSRVRNYSAI